jgi:DNA-binding beta-propeller fold protein YncE
MENRKFLRALTCTLFVFFNYIPNFFQQVSAQKLPFQFEVKDFLIFSPDALHHIQWGNTRKAISVETTPLAMAATAKNWSFAPDGKTVFLTKPQVSALKEGMKDGEKPVLGTSSWIYACDISNLSAPKVIDSVEVGKNPSRIALRPSGELLAVVIEQRDNEIALIEWKSGKFGNVAKNQAGFGDNKVFDCAWHPSGKYLALNIANVNQVALIYIRPFAKGIAFSKYGEPITVGKNLSTGQFTADGKHYLVSDFPTALSPEKGANSALHVLSFDVEEGKAHRLVGSNTLGENTQSFTVSPDGKYIAAVHARQTFLPIGDPKFGLNGAVSLHSIDTSGVVKNISEADFSGILPKSVAFDTQAKMLVVTVSEYHDLSPKLESMGGLEFFQVDKTGTQPVLKHTGFKMSVARGTHFVRVMR